MPRLLSPLPPLTSVYVRANGAEPALTTKVLDFQGTIDFIFVRYDAGVAAQALALRSHAGVLVRPFYCVTAPADNPA